MLKLSDATAVLLAGGKSSRMGSDKGLVEFRKKPMASHILEVVATLFSDVFLISNNDSYKDSGYQVFPDSITDKGPAGGIVSAIEHANSEWIFVVACDMPFITMEAILKLYDAKNDSEICLPLTKDGIEPLCGFYHSSIHKKLVEFDYAEKLFLNFNTRADLEAWKDYGS